MTKVIIYTDGSCFPNPGYGGWAAILKFRKKKVEISGSEPKSTNNRMELIAIIEAILYLENKCDITVYTDSKYAINGIGNWNSGKPAGRKGWMIKWERNKWQRKEGELKNTDLWQALYELSTHHTSLVFNHVNGHSGNILNERCDQLAARARKLGQKQISK